MSLKSKRFYVNFFEKNMKFFIFIGNYSRENEILKEKVQNYEKRLISNASEMQELQKEVKKISLERDHLKGISMKFQLELEDKDRILNVSLSPLKKGKTADFLTEHDYVESDIFQVKILFFIKIFCI